MELQLTNFRRINPDENTDSIQVVESNQADEEYNPHNHSDCQQPITYCESTLQYLKAAIGTGIFAMPLAFAEAGYVVAVIGIVLIGVLYTLCIHSLLRSEYELCKRRRVPNLSYSATVKWAFADGPSRLRWLSGSAEYVTDALLLAYVCGGCAVYVIFICKNIKNILDFYFGTDVDPHVLMAFIMLPIMLLCWFGNMKVLVWLSVVAHVFTAVSFVMVSWYIFKEPSHEGKRHAVQTAVRLPRYLSMVVFTVTSPGIVLPLKSKMRTPKLFSTTTGVLNLSMVVITLLCVIFGFFGYLKYGDEIESSITLNLPKHELMARCVMGLFSSSIFINYFFSYYVAFDIIWENHLKEKVRNQIWAEYGVRTSIPLFTFLMAYVIPNLDIFISLVGAVGIVSTSLVLPLIVHTFVFWNELSESVFVRNMILLALSVAILAVCLMDSVGRVILLWN